MVSNRILLGATAWSAVRVWGSRLTTLIVFFILARLLSPKDLGALSILASIILMVQVAVEASLAEFLVQAREKRPTQINSIFWGQLVLGALAALVMSTSSPFWAPRLIANAHAVAMACSMSSILIISSAGRIPDALLRSELRFRPIAIRSLVATFIGGGVGVSMAFAGFGLWSLIAKQIAETVTECIMNYYASDWRPSRPDFKGLAEPLKYGSGLSGNYLLTITNSRVDLFVIGATLGPVALGFYTVSARLFQTIYDLFAGIITQICVSLFAKVKGDIEATRSLHIRIMGLITLISVPIYSVTVVLGPRFLLWAAGAKWLPSGPVLQILCIAGPAAVAASFNSAILVADGRTSRQLSISLFNLALSVALFSIAAQFGLNWVAVAVIIRTLVVGVVGGQAAKKITGVSWYELGSAALPSIITGLVGAIVAKIVLFMISGVSPIVQLIAAGGSAVVAMLAVLPFSNPAAAKVIRAKLLKLRTPG